MSEPGSLEMSVVIVTPDCYGTIRRTMSFLRAQTVADLLEIVIVAPSQSALHIDDSELVGFQRSRIVQLGEVKSVAASNAAGVRQATAPVVAFIEEHSYPEPGWAEALVAAHRGDWASVGPEMHNANPDSVVSWADFWKAYGPWMAPALTGLAEHLPGHNSSYKRSILLEYGPELEAMLEAESVLHWDMRSRGHRLYLEPKAKVFHLNFGLMSAWIPSQYHGGRRFAASRARQWSVGRRVLYACGAPILRLLRCWRILRQVKGSTPVGRVLRVSRVLRVGLVSSAAGEMVGYGLGPGSSTEKLSAWEFHRSRYARGADGEAP